MYFENKLMWNLILHRYAKPIRQGKSHEQKPHE